VQRLAATGNDVVGVVRRPDAAADVAASGAEAVVADIVDADLDTVLAGADAVVWALGSRFGLDGPDGPQRIDHDGSLRAVEAGESAGVARWVHVSSMLADRPEAGPPMLEPFLRAKGAVDERLRGTSMAWTVLRPSGLSDEPGTGTLVAGEHLGPEVWGAGRPPQITRDDVASVALACLLEDLAVRQSLDLAGGATPISEALASS
jgi:uncharacterized protein YbjT (DUF2867 family)